MTYVIGTESALEAWSRDIDTSESLPRPPDAWPEDFNPQLDWVAGGLIPGTGTDLIPPQYYPMDPPVGWTAHYYGEPRLLESGDYAVAVEDRHAIAVEDRHVGTMQTADHVQYADPLTLAIGVDGNERG